MNPKVWGFVFFVLQVFGIIYLCDTDRAREWAQVALIANIFLGVIGWTEAHKGP